MENTKDLDWIKQSLQSAIELEYSTLPLYLSAMFSLEVQNYTAYNAIRSVAMEEMVHMAIASNMLAALGGTPQIKNIQVAFPTQGLPGGAEPDLNVGLACFSKNQLKNFMRIEIPQFLLGDLKLPEQYPTIAVFYNAIKQALIDNADAVRDAVKKGGTSSQVGDNIGFTTFTYDPNKDPLKMLCDGIDEILEQGEGNNAKTLITSSKFETEESHYAKFASLYYGAGYQKPKSIRKLTKANEPKFFKGLPIGWPEVVNTLAVPSDGYAKILAQDPNGATIKTALEAFDTAFSTMLANLDAVWNGPAATSWLTTPTVLGNATDGNLGTATGVGVTPNA
ncbi:MAG: ferritin-like protein, partial [Spirosomaceae bacterium]|nr:ferritin-like protein [Spirosomataceae bacterium]